MAFNPNAIFISPSSLSDFEKCPQLYYYRNLYRSPRGLKIQIINPSLALGQVVHDTLSRFLLLPPLLRTKDELLRIFNWIWSGLSGEKGGFLSTEEEKNYQSRALQMLERFFKNEHFRMAEAVKIPGFPKFNVDEDVILTGKLDWIEKEMEGYHVVDFKTGKNEEKEDSQQLPIYALLTSRLLNSEKIRTSYWYLDKDDDLVPFVLPEFGKTLRYLKQKGEILKLLKQTNSYRCQSGSESCWACRDILAIAQGKGKLVSVDPVNRRQEIYILVHEQDEKPQENKGADDLPF